jgi:hypothetical protein
MVVWKLTVISHVVPIKPPAKTGGRRKERWLHTSYDPSFDVPGFKNVLALRAEIEGTWGGKPPAPDRYYDLSYYKKALALLNH